MEQKAICKFCKKVGTVKIDDGYIGDPFRLIPMYSCNRCADLRVDRRRLWYKLLRVCRNLQMLPPTETKERETYRKLLVLLTKEYAGLIARWHGKEGMIWEEGVVDAIMDKPLKWSEIVSRLWTMFKLWKQQQEQSELPERADML